MDTFILLPQTASLPLKANLVSLLHIFICQSPFKGLQLSFTYLGSLTSTVDITPLLLFGM